jgi:phosphoglycolate phosphatase-like HAD superfamily hydrolase
MKLILFDIDGTLVSCDGQTRATFKRALESVYGDGGIIDTYDFSGKTDTRIVFDAMTGAGRPPAEVLAGIPRVRERYLVGLGHELDRARVRLLPGVGRLLERLASRSDVVLALLTGNWEGGARIKLASHDLNRYFLFGSFGDDVLDRNDLPPLAWERARSATGRGFTPDETLIVGDSLLDIACARAHGIRCLAVATGRTSAESLQAAGPDWLLAELTAALGHKAFDSLEPQGGPG